MAKQADHRSESPDLAVDPVASMPIEQRRHAFHLALAAVVAPFGVWMATLSTLGFAVGLATSTLMFCAARNLVLTRVAHQFRAAIGRQDGERARRWLSRLVTLMPRNDRVVDATRANLLAMCAHHEDWDRARSLIAHSAPESLAATLAGAVAANNVAWCLALMGEGERAVALAKQVLGLADRGVPGIAPGSKMHGLLLGTLGVALQKGGHHREAIDRLREALTIGGEPDVQSIRSFFLGEALAGSGAEEMAVEAYARAARERPGGRWARRAEERLAAMKPFR